MTQPAMLDIRSVAVEKMAAARRSGDYRPLSLLERFTAQYVVDNATGCWLWIGATTGPNRMARNGYGSMRVRGRQRPAHRVSWELYRGETDAATLDHLCRVRRCVNPDHLRPVSQRENIRAGTGLAALNARKTHCLRGHEFNKENTRINRLDGGRECRICQRERYRASRAAIERNPKP